MVEGKERYVAFYSNQDNRLLGFISEDYSDQFETGLISQSRGGYRREIISAERAKELREEADELMIRLTFEEFIARLIKK